MRYYKVKVTITGVEGEVLEQFNVTGLAEDYKGDYELGRRVRDLIEHSYETYDDGDEDETADH